MTESFLKAAIRDAAVTADARGLMPLAEARALVGALDVYEKGASEDSSVLGSDRAWAALLSLENGDEFLKAALRIRFKFHVRGHDNLAAFERYGSVILPWISAAIDARGTLRNVPWCLYPCLLAIGTADALEVAFRIHGVSGELDEPTTETETENDHADPPEAESSEESPPRLGAAPAWVAKALPTRLGLVADRARSSRRAAALLGHLVGDLGVPGLEILRAHLGTQEAVEVLLGALGIAIPRADPEIEAALSGLPCAAVPAGPPWSVALLDQDDMFPYWNVLDGYETPCAIRVSAFGAESGDVLVVQRITHDERASEPGTRHIAVYGPGARAVAAGGYVPLLSEADTQATHLPTGDGWVRGISEVAEVYGDADAYGVAVPDAYKERKLRNPMPHAGALVAISGTEGDVEIAPQLPSEWGAIALRAASGDPALADKMLRSIGDREGALWLLVHNHREKLFLNEAGLRALGSIPTDGELLFELDDPPLPHIYMDRPPSKTAPWPLFCEALRRRVKLDPRRIEHVDVLFERLRWTEGRGGPEDCWGPEMTPCAPELPRGIGATAHADLLLSRGFPHGVRLLHQHPHNDSPEAVFDWLIAQPELPLRSYWAREIAVRFVRHAGADPNARENGAWIYENEARRIVGGLLFRAASTLSPLACEHVTLLLEAFIGASALLEAVVSALTAIPEANRGADRLDGFHALLAIGWVLRRAISAEALEQKRLLVELSADFPREGDLGRALDLVLFGAEAAKRSARTASECLFSSDRARIEQVLGTTPIPLDLQFAVALGEQVFDSWDTQNIGDADKSRFADDLRLLSSPRARLLAAKLST